MKIGIFCVADHYPRELSRDLSRFYEELLEQVVAAEELGFSSFWIAEHHFHEYGAVPRPPIFLSAAARLTSRIRLGSAVVVLPFDNPLRTAEDFAMVDILSGGRLCLGVGSGYLKHEYEGFGVEPSSKRERFDESLDILRLAWSGKRFSYHGRYHKVDHVRLNVRPVQEPHPPVSIAILSDQAAPFVAQKGYGLMMIPYATTERVEELSAAVAAYRAGFREDNAGTSEQFDAPVVRFALHAYCDDRGLEPGLAALERYVRTRLYARQRSFDELDSRNLLAFGDPEKIARILDLYEGLGADELLLIVNFGGLAHRDVLASMSRIAACRAVML
ncbi:MAG: LLM class flavin-dependent oxidoreductase [Cyanobacteria bacterium HKST-UBA02]|nr:LLM class flavin-dependent oxidoreductase [Cyanobacteria bacterium HKST-UBA02]